MIVADGYGTPSIGYTVRLFSGNPEFGGTEILTTAGLTGAGNLATVGWVFNYSCGLLLLSDDFKGTIADLTQLYICGFRYIGGTAQGEAAVVFENSVIKSTSDLIEQQINLILLIRMRV